MSQLLQVKENNVIKYSIMIERDYTKFHQILEQLDIRQRKICIISDTNTSIHYENEIIEITKDYASIVETITIPSGETHKNLNTVNKVYQHLIESKFDRNDILIALGGGVVGDLTGFVAATYLRGIRFIQLPTTLLAMTDSSIGGKTGVDYLTYKNMIGAFHQPTAVYINLSTLKTLSIRQYCSGFGEVIKYGLIKDINFYEWLRDKQKDLLNYDLESQEEMIFKSCQYKQRIVEEDPKELGERALLNFGHTLGHAIEKHLNFEWLHGECVAIGMLAATYISFKRGYINKQELYHLKDLLQLFSLPTLLPNTPNTNELIESTKNDKKMESGKIKFILLKEIGMAFIDKTVTDEEMVEAISYIKQTS